MNAYPQELYPGCPCYACDSLTWEPWPGLSFTPPQRMSLCPTCGDKRCPGAADHRRGCERRQPGDPMTETRPTDEIRADLAAMDEDGDAYLNVRAKQHAARRRLLFDVGPLLARVSELERLWAEAIQREQRSKNAHWYDLGVVEAERDAAVARAEQAEIRIEIIRKWATTIHGGTKAPIDVWPGLTAALADPAPSNACPECANDSAKGQTHELWCSFSPPTLTMGELREMLTKAIELDGVNETKRVGLLATRPHWNIGTDEYVKPVTFGGVRFMRGEFVFVLTEPLADPAPSNAGEAS